MAQGMSVVEAAAFCISFHTSIADLNYAQVYKVAKCCWYMVSLAIDGIYFGRQDYLHEVLAMLSRWKSCLGRRAHCLAKTPSPVPLISAYDTRGEVTNSG
jgi:hypothetical protein